MFKRFGFFAACLVIGGCKGDEKQEVPADFADCSRADGDDYELVNVDLNGNVLATDVRYLGGCEDHEFAICWPGQSFLESDPVQTTLELWHGANGDECDDVEFDVEFTWDLTPLKEAYQDAYGVEEGTIDVFVGEELFSYTF